MSRTMATQNKKNKSPPLPDAEVLGKEVEFYLAVDWARGRISLIDFLRKTTKDGAISAWLVREHAAAATQQTLEEFAAEYALKGQKDVAVEFLSRLKDQFYGQWLMTFVPFNE